MNTPSARRTRGGRWAASRPAQLPLTLDGLQYQNDQYRCEQAWPTSSWPPAFRPFKPTMAEGGLIWACWNALCFT